MDVARMADIMQRLEWKFDMVLVPLWWVLLVLSVLDIVFMRVPNFIIRLSGVYFCLLYPIMTSGGDIELVGITIVFTVISGFVGAACVIVANSFRPGSIADGDESIMWVIGFALGGVNAIILFLIATGLFHVLVRYFIHAKGIEVKKLPFIPFFFAASIILYPIQQMIVSIIL